MKAIIVPGVTDMNKGDQALVWESHRLVKDTELYDDIYIVTTGDTQEERDLLCKQSEAQGYSFVENIMKHPRRGKHLSDQHINESFIELAKQIKNAIFDFISSGFLLLICNYSFLVRLFYSKKIIETVNQFRIVDTVYVKGGGFIHAYGEKTAPYLMWYFLFYVRLAKRLNKKVVFFPNSFGPFEGFTVKRQVRTVFNKLDLIYAREQVSSDSLSSLLSKQIPVEMDLGFFLEKGNYASAQKVLEKYGLYNDERIVGITIRPWRFPGKENPTELYEKYIKSIVDLCNHLINNNYTIALCNQSLGPNSHEDDRNAIKEVLSKVQHKNIVWIDENLPCDVLKAIYSNFYFFVGTRFHSIIFSLTSSVPSIAIGYGGNKAKGIMGDFNLDDYVIQIHEVNSEQLISIFDNAINNYKSIKEKLDNSMKLVQESRNRMILDIKKMYNRS